MSCTRRSYECSRSAQLAAFVLPLGEGISRDGYVNRGRFNVDVSCVGRTEGCMHGAGPRGCGF